MTKKNNQEKYLIIIYLELWIGKSTARWQEVTGSSTLQGLKLWGRDFATSGMVCLEQFREGHSHNFKPEAKCHNLTLNQVLAVETFFHGTVYLMTAVGGISKNAWWEQNLRALPWYSSWLAHLKAKLSLL